MDLPTFSPLFFLLLLLFVENGQAKTILVPSPSFPTLVEAANVTVGGDVIQLASNSVISCGSNVQGALFDFQRIGGGISIAGDGSPVINCNGGSRAITAVMSQPQAAGALGIAITIVGIQFNGGSSSSVEGGGAVLISGPISSVFINNCNFNNNRATGTGTSTGGAAVMIFVESIIEPPPPPPRNTSLPFPSPPAKVGLISVANSNFVGNVMPTAYAALGGALGIWVAVGITGISIDVSAGSFVANVGAGIALQVVGPVIGSVINLGNYGAVFENNIPIYPIYAASGQPLVPGLGGGIYASFQSSVSTTQIKVASFGSYFSQNTIPSGGSGACAFITFAASTSALTLMVGSQGSVFLNNTTPLPSLVAANNNSNNNNGSALFNAGNGGCFAILFNGPTLGPNSLISVGDGGSLFFGNVAGMGGTGGAISVLFSGDVQGTRVSVGNDGSQFLSNSATGGGTGGAIQVAVVSGNIVSSTKFRIASGGSSFSNNVATINSAAAAAAGTSSSTPSLFSVVGGAVEIEISGSATSFAPVTSPSSPFAIVLQIAVDGSVFNGNFASFGGGAIAISIAQNLNNLALVSVGSNGTSFISNSASSEGGALLFQVGGTISGCGNVNIGSGSLFQSNIAENTGGAMFVDLGGAVTHSSVSIACNSSSFVGNSNGGSSTSNINRQGTGGGGGGAIFFATSSNLPISYSSVEIGSGGSSFASNSASFGNGGAICTRLLSGVQNSTVFGIGNDGSSFLDNFAGLGGGAISFREFGPVMDAIVRLGSGYSSFTSNIATSTSTSSTSSSSSATGNGGAIFVEAVSSQQQQVQQGCLFLRSALQLGFDSLFSRNFAGQGGAAIFTLVNGGVVSGSCLVRNATIGMKGTSFNNNGEVSPSSSTSGMTSSSDSAVILQISSTSPAAVDNLLIEVSNSEFVGNQGGGLRIVLPSDNIRSNECLMCSNSLYPPTGCGFANNTSVNSLPLCNADTGMVQNVFLPILHRSFVFISQTGFAYNYGATSGGGLAVTNGFVYLQDCVFHGNSATNQAGGLFVGSGTAAVTFDGQVSFQNNWAPSVAEILISSSGSVIVRGSNNALTVSSGSNDNDILTSFNTTTTTTSTVLPPPILSAFDAVSFVGVGQLLFNTDADNGTDFFFPPTTSTPALGSIQISCPPGFNLANSSSSLSQQGVASGYSSSWPSIILKTNVAISCSPCGSGSYGVQSGNASLISNSQPTVWVSSPPQFIAPTPASGFSIITSGVQCLDCPYGGLCGNGGSDVRIARNFWGFVDPQSNSWEISKCPIGYCCEDRGDASPNNRFAPGDGCSVLTQCPKGRDPTVPLCGACLSGYSQDLIQNICVKNEACNDDGWVWPVMVIFTVVWTVVIIGSSNPSSSGQLQHVGSGLLQQRQQQQQQKEHVDISWVSPTLFFFFQNVTLIYISSGTRLAVSVVQTIILAITNLHLTSSTSNDGDKHSPSSFQACAIRNLSTVQGMAIRLAFPFAVVIVVAFVFIILKLVVVLCFRRRDSNNNNNSNNRRGGAPDASSAAPLIVSGRSGLIENVADRAAPTAVKLVLLFYTGVVSVLGSFLFCVPITQGSSTSWVLFRAGQVQCYQDWQNGLWFLFAVVAIPLPLYMLLLEIVWRQYSNNSRIERGRGQSTYLLGNVEESTTVMSVGRKFGVSFDLGVASSGGQSPSDPTMRRTNSNFNNNNNQPRTRLVTLPASPFVRSFVQFVVTTFDFQQSEIVYLENRWYWSAYTLFRRLIVAIIFAFVAEGSVQCILFAVAFMCFGMIQTHASPFRSWMGNFVEVNSMFALALTSLCNLRSGAFVDAVANVVPGSSVERVSRDLEILQSFLFFWVLLIAAVCVLFQCVGDTSSFSFSALFAAALRKRRGMDAVAVGGGGAIGRTNNNNNNNNNSLEMSSLGSEESKEQQQQQQQQGEEGNEE